MLTLSSFLRRFPRRHNVWEWAILRYARPGETEQIAQGSRNDAPMPLKRTISLKLNPMSATDAVDNHWRCLIEGDTDEAARLLQTYRYRGVPLPAAR